MHESGLRDRLALYQSAGGFTTILVNSLIPITNTTPVWQVVQSEPFQATGHYAPQTTTFAGAGTYASNTLSATSAASFSASGTSYSFTHVVLMRGRAGRANSQISAVDFGTDQLTITGHGLPSGLRCFIRSTGAVPTGLSVQGYHLGIVDANTVELYTDAGLTTKATFGDAGSGTLYLQNAGGSIWRVTALSGVVNPGSPQTVDMTLAIT